MKRGGLYGRLSNSTVCWNHQENFKKYWRPSPNPRLCVGGTLEVLRVPGDGNLLASLRSFALPGGARAGRSEHRVPLGGAAHSARRSGRRVGAAARCAPAPPPPGGPRGMQPAGGGAPRPGRGHPLPGSLLQLDPVALLMLLVDADRPEPVRSGARELALFLTPEPGAEAKQVEETIEGMLLRLEEFCSLTDMIRSDTSQILEENIPLLQAKVTEMRGIYAKVNQLEAFVKMVGRHVSFLEAHVLQAERDHGAFSQALRRWLGSAGLPSFRNKPPAPPAFELPALYRTEDYFPAAAGPAALRTPCPRRRRV